MKEHKKFHLRNQTGFSLIELLVYLGILGILMSAVVISFTKTMRQSAQQSSIAETQIETGAGLEILRADLDHAGFGLYWFSPGTPTPFSEPAPLAGLSTEAPRAFSSTEALGISLNDSDYLVIRAMNVTRGVSGQKWGYVGRDGTGAHPPVVQSMSSDAFKNTDRVIVVQLVGNDRYMVMNGTTYFTKIIDSPATVPPLSLANSAFAPDPTPSDPDGVKYLVYGLNDDDQIRRPFNRTDYYINNTSVPSQCAPNTGVLYKRTLNQQDDNFVNNPIVDCVADFQVVYHLDPGTGVQTPVDANGLTVPSVLTAEQIRGQVKSVQCYILTHEGGVDRSYTYPNAFDTINVGEVDANGALIAGRPFTLSTTIGGNWANYRWKVLSLSVSPKNLK